MKLKIFFSACLITCLTAGAQVPAVQLSDMQGEKMNTAVFNRNDDKLILIAFWATWCIPCINELTAINELLPEWKQNLSFELFAVSVDDSRTANRIKSVAGGKDWDFTVLSDKNQELKRALNISNVPYTLIIKNGRVIYRHSGYVDGDETALFKILKENK